MYPHAKAKMKIFTAFIAKVFKSQKEFFSKFQAVGTDLSTVRAVINGPKGLEVTFLKESSLLSFLEKAPTDWGVSSEISQEVVVTLAPKVGSGHATVADSAVWGALSKFGKIKEGRRLFYSDFPHIENGVRQLKMKVEKSLPGSIHFGRAGFQLQHRGQRRECHRCKSTTHLAAQCTVLICYKCRAAGHKAESCTEQLKCVVCGLEGHAYFACPSSLALKVSLGKSWSRAEENHDAEQRRETDHMSDSQLLSTAVSHEETENETNRQANEENLLAQKANTSPISVPSEEDLNDSQLQRAAEQASQSLQRVQGAKADSQRCLDSLSELSEECNLVVDESQEVEECDPSNTTSSETNRSSQEIFGTDLSSTSSSPVSVSPVSVKSESNREESASPVHLSQSTPLAAQKTRSASNQKANSKANSKASSKERKKGKKTGRAK